MLRMRKVKTGIYKITNLDNGKMYVGQARDIYYRWSQHKSNLRSNSHENAKLQNSWNLHGENAFEFSVIEECSKDKLDEREIFWILELNTYVGFEVCNGYNLTLGGAGTKIIHEVLQFDLNGDFIKEWQNGIIAGATLGINYGTLYGVLTKRYKYAGNYIFIYKENYIGRESLDWYLDRKGMRVVLQYNKDAELINRFNSLSEANKYLGYDVNSCVSHICVTSHGYIFVYEDEGLIIDKHYCEWAFSLLNNICNKPFYQLDKDGNIIKKYNCLREAVENGYNEKMVNDCVRGLINKYKGFIWVYEQDLHLFTKEKCNEIFNEKRKSNRNVPVLQFKDGIFVNRYESLSKLPDEFLKGSVSSCCRGIKPQYKGYTWEYELTELKGA